MNAWLATGPALPWAVVNVVAAEAAAAAEHVRAFLEGSEPFEPSLWAIEVGETTCELLSSAATTNRFRCTTSDQTDAWTRQLSAAWVAQSIHTVTVTDGVPVGNPSNGQYRDPLQAITDDYLSWLAATYTEGAWVDRQCALFYAGNPPCVAIFLADENVNTWLASEPPVLDLLAPLED